MDDKKRVHVRFYHAGIFKKTLYSGGQTRVICSVDVDLFSYTVLMEYVKDHLHYTEIGGVYCRNENGPGWNLVTNDKELFQLVDGCNSGDEIILYVDNIIDKDIQPLNQMQPHVVVRPRKNLIQVSAKKPVTQPLKRQFVTRNQLQQQQQKQRRVNKSPELLPRRILSPRSCKKVSLETIQLEEATVNPRATARRKLNLQKDTKKGEKSDDNDIAVELPPKKPVNRYELLRIRSIEENDRALEKFGLGKYASKPNQPIVEQSKGKEIVEEESDEYIMENEIEDGSSDSTEEAKSVKARKIVRGPRTRSQANATALSEKDPVLASTVNEKDATLTATATKKELTSSFRENIIKPTCSKLLKQSGNLGGSGSLAAYLALRERQKKKLEASLEDHQRTEDAVESSLPDADVEEVEPAPKRSRGRTKMSKVYSRSGDDKPIITLNSRGQPVGNDKSTLSELSNYLGTLVRDNVSLAYINWHVVPEALKKKMWEYTLDKYIIPEEGEKWVRKTLNSSWRVYKARIKKNYYTKYSNYDERIKNKPTEIPEEDFKMLILYWAEEGVEAMAMDNAARRNSYTETHTLGTKSLAQVRDKLKNKDPNHASPSAAKIFLKSRKRKEGREYKSDADAVQKKIDDMKKLIKEGKDADVMLSTGKSRGIDWLVGRQGRSGGSTTTTPLAPSHAIPEPYVEELTAKITQNVESEMEEKVNRKVQENLAWFLKKLGEANPGMKLDIGELCAATSSNKDQNNNPITPISQVGTAPAT